MSIKTCCHWANRSPAEREYHDTEWGTPLHEDRKIFEFLILEGMQAGLSWTTIMNKRDSMREAFDGFDYNVIAHYDAQKEAELMVAPGIIHNKLKIKALAKNARAFKDVQTEFGSFDAYIWKFTSGKTVTGNWVTEEEIPAESGLSKLISLDMKKRGFTFVGPTIIYSFLQAIGILNDHVISCFRYDELESGDHHQ